MKIFEVKMLFIILLGVVYAGSSYSSTLYTDKQPAPTEINCSSKQMADDEDFRYKCQNRKYCAETCITYSYDDDSKVMLIQGERVSYEQTAVVSCESSDYLTQVVYDVSAETVATSKYPACK